MDRNETLSAQLDFAGDRDYFKVAISGGGMLDLDLTSFGGFEPRLQFLGKDCGGWSAAEIYYVERSDLKHIIHVLQPGDYFFRVLADTSSEGAYELSTGFVADPVGISQHLTPVGALPDKCGPGLLELGLSDGDGRQVRMTKESEPTGGEVVVVSTPEPGRILIQAGGIQMLGSLYADDSCSASSQIAADVPLDGLNRLVVSVEAGEYYLRLSPQSEALGIFDLTTAFYPLP